MNLSASLLPVAAAQHTEAVQLVPVELHHASSGSGGGDAAGAGGDNNNASSSSSSLEHSLLAVCHPHAVAAYEASGRAQDLVEAGVAGFCAVERVLHETSMIHLLCPSAGSLPSNVLLLGDVTWME